MVSLELPPDRQNFDGAAHGLGQFCAPGKWFGMKLVINTVEKGVTGYVRSEGGKWVQLNKTPLPYHDPRAQGGAHLFISAGSRKHEVVDNNIVEMDNVRVTQVSSPQPPKQK